MITKTEAIVLKTVDYSESSIIATLFTRKHGTIAVIAKGARKPKNKFSAYLVVGQVLEVVYYMKSTRSVQTLSDASYYIKLGSLRIDIEKMALTMSTMEFIRQVIHDNEVNTELFDFILKLLEWLDKQETVAKIIFPYIQLRVLEYVGIGLQPDETVLQKTSKIGYINIETGSLSESSEGSQSIKLSEKQTLFLKTGLTSKSSTVFDIKMADNELKDLIEYLDRYIRYHIEGVKARRSDVIFDQLLNGYS
jgi:DNA repair protein RecO (recombination protein O)